MQVPDEILIDRCVGRRMDPVTGKIYHLTNFPPENEEISARLIARPDDTLEKVFLTFLLLHNDFQLLLSTKFTSRIESYFILSM